MFEVEWLEAAADELATIWTDADSADRQAITSATHSIDQELQAAPHTKGESRPNGRRICFAPPLGVTFRADRKNKLVTVVHVWRFRTSR